MRGSITVDGRGRMAEARTEETAIVGAGAAGLAAAAELVANGRRVVVVEARDRLGGRILTQSTSAVPVPMELGAEFIHGQSSEFLRWLKASQHVAIDAGGERWTAQDGQLRRTDSQLHRLKRMFEQLAPLDRDVSFADFLQRHRQS